MLNPNRETGPCVKTDASEENRHDVENLVGIGLITTASGELSRLASFASANNVVQHPEIIPGIQLSRPCCSGPFNRPGGRFGDEGGLSSSSIVFSAKGASSVHCLTSSSIPRSSILALASKSFQRPGPQKGSSSKAFFMARDQNSNIGR